VTLATLHVQRVERWQRWALEDWGAIWAKIVNPPQSVESPFPNQRVVVRWWTDDIDSDYIARGYTGGVAFVRRMLPVWRDRPYATAYELANEPDVNDPWWRRQVVAYSRGAMDEANQHGIKLVILLPPEASPHGGDPYSPELRIAKCRELVPAVKQAVEQGHYVGMHAYWRPGVAGPTDSFHALGHVALTASVWGDAGVDLDRLQLLVTETGIDGGIAGHTPRQGWRDFMDIGAYAQQIAEAEMYARALGYVKALMLFTAGYQSPWGRFDLVEADCRVIGRSLRSLPPPVSPGPVVDDSWIAETRQHRLRLNPDAALKQAIEAAGQCCASNEFDATGHAESATAFQYGFANNTWYLWKWSRAEGVKVIYTEKAERGS